MDCPSGNPWISWVETGGRTGTVRDLVRQKENESKRKWDWKQRQRRGNIPNTGSVL